MIYLLDTSVCIEYTAENRAIMAKVHQHTPKELGISAITLLELERGIFMAAPAFKKSNREFLERFLKQVKVFPFDKKAALHAAPLFAKWERQGCRPGEMDGLIACHSNGLGLKLAYCDGDFQRLKLPRLELWPKR
ncbi:MAG: type II toxin-antitoxin system VapC family toxin [Pseudomonadota bacterium]|nr:type II toxin-antitoxin system VapC family toxin [Pseudomonadota bacterium]